MHIKRSFILLLFLVLLGGLGTVGTVMADAQEAPAAQPTPFPTPTPGPDGRITYIVQPRDTFFDIAAIAGITLEELFALNGIQATDFAIPGMELLLGFAGPVQATAAPGSVDTATPVEATATPIFNTGEICVLLFLDVNGNARLEEDEMALADGQINVVNSSGTLAAESTTTEDAEGHCFQGLQAGEYNVSAAVPSGYNPTTSMNIPLRLQAGDIKFIQFGAQASAATTSFLSATERDKSIWYGIFGVLLLATAAGIGYYALKYGR